VLRSAKTEAEHQMKNDARDGQRRDARGLAAPETGQRVPGPNDGRLRRRVSLHFMTRRSICGASGRCRWFSPRCSSGGAVKTGVGMNYQGVSAGILRKRALASAETAKQRPITGEG